MKRKYLSISLFVLLLCFMAYSFIDRVPQNYKIENAKLCKIKFKDRIYNNYYLLTFDVEYCNFTYEFLKAPKPSGRNGSIDKIQSMTVLDNKGHNIPAFLLRDRGKNDDERYLSIVYPDKSDSAVIVTREEGSLNEITNKINSNKDGGRPFRVDIGRIVQIESIRSDPLILKIVFSDRQIISKVDNRASLVSYER